MTTIDRPDWLALDLFPFTVRSLDLPGGTVAYVDEGEGPTLLFVHAGMWSFLFRDVIAHLRADFRCIALDFPGYGLAPDAERPLSLREISAVLGEVVDELDLTDVTLVLHDLGGPAALAMAGPRADRIRGLVLANTFLWTPDTRALRTMLRTMGSRPVAAAMTATNLLVRLSAGRFGVGRHLSRAERRTFRGPYRRWAHRWRFHSTMRSAIGDPDLTAAAERAAVGPLNDRPVLTIFGERNDPFGFQARHEATFPDHEGIVVEGGNHFPMMDAPDLFAETVREWHLRKVAHTAQA